MGLSSAMNVGVTGLGINAEAITVVGNNIANVNTVGFKEGRTLFSDVLSQSTATGQVGRGGQLQAIQNNFTQAGLENTVNSNDLAIQGNGFFVVQDSTGRNYYTRAGAFDYNKSQVLVNPDGLNVVGYGINQATGLSNNIEGKIDKTAFATLTPKTTTSASAILNLNSAASTPGSSVTSKVTVNGDFGTVAVAPPALPTTATFYDEFGTAQTATITWGGTSPSYTYSIAIPTAAPGTPGSVATGNQIVGTLTFPSTTTSVTATLTLNNNARPMPVTFDFSNIQNTAAASAPTTTANGSAIKTGTVAISGGANVAGPVVAAFTTDTGGALAGAAGTTTVTLNPVPAVPLLSLGMTVSSSAGTIPANTVITGISGNNITLSNAITGAGVLPAQTLTFGGNGYPGAFTTTAIANNSTTITPLAMPPGVVVGQYVSGVGIPLNTYITAIDAAAGTITLSKAATANNAAAALNYSSNIHVNVVDTAGTVRNGALIPQGSVALPAAVGWQAVVDGASNTISGTLTAGATGSTWTQTSANLSINGVNQNINFDFSLATNATTGPIVNANGFDITNPAVTSNFSNSFQVYDTLGNAHTATVYYSKTGANAWDYHLSVPDAKSINGMTGNRVLNGTLTFNNSGSMIAQTPNSSSGIAIEFPGGAGTQTMTLDLNPSITTQRASESLVSSINQNGYGAGNLIKTTIDSEGYVSATYSNNQIQRIAQIALAKFDAVDGLEKNGNSLYLATTKSGAANIGSAFAQGSKIFTNSLEQSNVDMATQLVNMIKLQRAYSGNSKTITSSDEMMQETLSLKR